MILPLVSELLSRIARLRPIQQGSEKLRRKEAEVTFAGFTDSAKAILAPLIFRELGRPIILLVESNQRAEELLEPLRWFYAAATAKPGARVVRFPPTKFYRTKIARRTRKFPKRALSPSGVSHPARPIW